MAATFYLGRNIKRDQHGYYLVFSDKDLTSSRDQRYARNHHATYAKALKQMDYLLDNGATWFDSHYDPTI